MKPTRALALIECPACGGHFAFFDVHSVDTALGLPYSGRDLAGINVEHESPWPGATTVVLLLN